MLPELLPLLRGWRDFSVIIDEPIIIAPGQEYVIAESIYPGWLYSLQVALTGSGDAKFIIERYDPREGFEAVVVKPSGLLAFGFDSPNSAGPYVSKWDSATQFYCIAYTPASPLPYWAKEGKPCRIVLQAPDDIGISLNSYTQVAYEVVDRKEFIESLREVLITKSSVEVIR